MLQTGKAAGSIFARVTHPLGEDIVLHADLRAAAVEQKQQAAPSTSQITNAAPAPGQPDSLVYSFNDLGPVEETTRSTLASITAPVLLIHGDHDRLVPVQAARRTAEMFPAWRYEEMRDIGHVPMLEAAPQTAELIRGWLRDCFT